MKSSNYWTDNQKLRQPKNREKVSYLLLFLAINLYSLLVPIRVFTTKSVYTGIEIFLLVTMCGMIIINLILKPYLIRKYGLEQSIFYMIIMFSLLGTIFMRADIEVIQLIKYLRYLYTPFIFSLLILTSEFNKTKFFNIRKYLFIPVISLLIAIVSSVIQLINPSLIRELMVKSQYYNDISRSTNFVRGSVFNRLIGVFDDPNLFGAFLVLNIIFIALYLDNKHEFKNSIKFIIPLLIILFFTTSRSAIITLLLCSVVFFISKINLNKLNYRNFLKNIFIFLIFVCLLLGGLAWIFRSLNLSFETLINTRFNIDNINEFITLNNRTIEWGYYVDVFTKNLLTILLGVDSNDFQLSFNSIENTFIGFNLKFGMIIFILTCLYLFLLLSKSKMRKIEKRVIITYLLLISFVLDIDTLLFIVVPIFSYISLSYSQ